MEQAYQITQWRKRLERRGWISIRRSRPIGGWYEYHVIWRGKLYSGRAKASQAGSMTPGTAAYFMHRYDLAEGVWRKCPAGKAGQMVRALPVSGHPQSR